MPGGAKIASTGIVVNSPQANACTTSADCASGYICEPTFGKFIGDFVLTGMVFAN